MSLYGHTTELADRVRGQMRAKGATNCPLCDRQSWDFSRVRLVFLMDAKDTTSLGDDGRLKAAGPAIGSSKSEAERGLAYLQRQLKPVRDAARKYPLAQLTCGNCGHTILMDVGSR